VIVQLPFAPVIPLPFWFPEIQASPLSYKVDNYSIGKDGPKVTLKFRHNTGLAEGPPNALVQPVDTIGG
jgi:hypothetical protein